jgi:hypothetical protein
MRRLAAAAVLALAAPAGPTGGAGSAPAQPLHFSHRVHAGDQRIGCTSCHVYAARSPVAGVPSMARCQGCHKFVKQDPEQPRMTEAMRPLLEKLRERPPSPIAWARVHRLPDHVYFTHERHVRAGVRCADCHGEVEKMDEVRQVASLEMGWCLACHRRAQGERPAGRAGLTECVTCHK